MCLSLHFPRPPSLSKKDSFAELDLNNVKCYLFPSSQICQRDGQDGHWLFGTDSTFTCPAYIRTVSISLVESGGQFRGSQMSFFADVSGGSIWMGPRHSDIHQKSEICRICTTIIFSQYMTACHKTNVMMEEKNMSFFIFLTYIICRFLEP